MHKNNRSPLFYTWLLRALFPVIIFHLIVRGLKNRNYWRRWRERFGFITAPAPDRLTWIHAVSVGEVRAAALLVPTLMERYPSFRILITTMTPTGSDQVRSIFGDKVEHFYVPYDYPSAVKRFLDRTRPMVAIVMETELWPNLFHECGARNIPLLVSNVRMSESSMKGYLRIPNITRSTLEQVALFAVQNSEDAERLKRLGAPEDRIHITGSIKFEIDIPASQREAAEVLRREWGQNRNIWIAASTHEGEDELALAAHKKLKRHYPDLLLVLVPRHPERFTAVERQVRRAGFNVLLRSEQSYDINPEIDVIVGDTMGELQLFFAAVDIAFIGGSLVPTGGHNLLEAAAAGTPVIIGPHTFNFREITRLAVERGHTVQINHAGELAGAVAAWIDHPERRAKAGEAGQQLVTENKGALAGNIELISRLLPAS
jgi:3-deoxy-D-manno-octulosonic-acid transferase